MVLSPTSALSEHRGPWTQGQAVVAAKVGVVACGNLLRGRTLSLRDLGTRAREPQRTGE